MANEPVTNNDPFAGKSDDELVAHNQDLGKQVDELQAQRRTVNEELDRRRRAATARSVEDIVNAVHGTAPGAVITADTTHTPGNVNTNQ